LITIPSRHQDLTFNQLKIFYEGKGKLLNAHFAKTLDFLMPDGKYNQLAFLFADNNNISIRVAKWWGTDRFEFTTYGGLVEGLTHEEFFSGVSRPRNPEIMKIFKDLEYVERLGSGIPYIVSKYSQEIFKLMPSVIRFAYFFDTSVNGESMPFSRENHLKTTEKPPENHLKTSPKTILKLSENYPKTIQKPPKNHPKTT
jgi:predicted HTH transcriptional regulator